MSTARMTKRQKGRAISLFSAFTRDGVPDGITPREASRLCEQQGVTNDRFRRVAKREQDFRLIRLLDVCVEIAKKEARR